MSLHVKVAGGTGAGKRIVREPAQPWRCECGVKPGSHRNCGQCGRRRP